LSPIVLRVDLSQNIIGRCRSLIHIGATKISISGSKSML
jgi:hypothetical protein